MSQQIKTRPKALLFDWDNTLVNTWPAIHDANNYTLVAMGHEPWTFEETLQRVRKSMRDSSLNYLAIAGKKPLKSSMPDSKNHISHS